MTARDIEAWLVAHLSEALTLDPSEIDVREPFASYGLDSVRAVGLSGDLEEWLGRQLSPTLAYEYPTIESLARHLAGEPDPDAGPGVPTSQPAHGPADPRGAPGPASEPIAIVGIGCRFPGAEDGPSGFWRLVAGGGDAITEVPVDRWDVDAFYDPDAGAPGKMNTRWGGFLSRVDLFDPYAFGISPREAARMDPQQRLLLETAWEALDDAGQPRAQLAGGKTGVFVGISSNDYGQIQLTDPGLSDPHAGTGNALSVAANRLSYLLDLHGPSLAVDTACSSSLVALHLACESLRSGECTLALVGGVNVILSPAITVNFTKAGFMAPDGRCKAFDASANGYVRGEGAGVVVLKPLSAALAGGDRIYAVVRGSAVNSDGRTNGLTAPNGRAQAAVLERAYARAGVPPDRVRFVECHGTGTAIGDRIEALALAAVFAEGRPPERPLVIGSVKTNIGHLEAAAGIAGFIKTALALAHRQIPPSLHFRDPNPLIPFDDARLRVSQRLEALPAGPGPAAAGVSAFGFGGTNAHIVLEEAPPAAADGIEPPVRPRRLLLPLSAHSPEALRSLAGTCADMLAGNDLALEDLCYTASVRRDHHDHRLAVTGASRDAMVERLRDAQRRLAPTTAGRRPRVAFVFSGQGPQWYGMGRELLAEEPAFREAVEHIDVLFRAQAGWSLLDELGADEALSRLHRTDVAQPAIFALQAGLVALWRSWGVEPDAVTGHSVGEVTAAYVAGALTLEDAVRVIFHRGRLSHKAAGKGQMAALEMPVASARDSIAGYENRLWIAAVNSPTSTTVAGDQEALVSLLKTLQPRGVHCRMLPLDYAFHTPQMEPYHDEIAAALAGLRPRAAARVIVSTVTGRQAPGEAFDASYWRRNVREPVQFASAIDELIEQGVGAFVEISPHPVLGGAVAQCLRGRDREGSVLASLRRGEPERTTLLTALGSLFVLGHPVNWQSLYPSGRLVRMPLYPWQRERLWRAPAAASTMAAVSTTATADLEHQDSATGGGESGALQVSETADLFYALEWARSDRTDDAARRDTAAEPGTWIVFADRQGVGNALAAYLREDGHRVVRVDRAETYDGTDGTRVAIRADVPDDIDRLLRDALGDDTRSCRGIVYLWPLDARLDERAPDAMATAQTLTATTPVSLVQGLNRIRWRTAPRLWLVTLGAQAVQPQERDLRPEGAITWGLGRTLAVEHAALWGGLIDLDPSAAPCEMARAVRDELVRPDNEDQLAWRDGVRYAARLRRSRRSPAVRALRWRPDGSYLITGGLGDLGFEVARWMVGQGARRVLLLGRTPLPPRREWSQLDPASRDGRRAAAVRDLERRGASVHVVDVDIADAAAVRSFLKDFAAEGWPPIRGLVHAAGIVDMRTLLETDAASLATALAAKAGGAWLLHDSLHETLDFRVYFSSVSALLGSPRLAGYAAANAFLDTLSHYERAQGQFSLSINWGFWTEAGMAARQRPTREVAPRGSGGLTTREALDALDRLLRSDVGQAAVMRFDWHAWRQVYPQSAASPYLRSLYEADGASRASPGGAARLPASTGIAPTIDRETLQAADSAERTRLLESFLLELVAMVLQIPLARVELHRPLTALGLDSMMAVQLKNAVDGALGVNINLVQFLEGSSIADLAQLLSSEVVVGAVEPGAPTQPAPAALLQQLDQLSESEVEALLLRMSASDDPGP